LVAELLGNPLAKLSTQHDASPSLNRDGLLSSLWAHSLALLVRQELTVNWCHLFPWACDKRLSTKDRLPNNCGSYHNPFNPIFFFLPMISKISKIKNTNRFLNYTTNYNVTLHLGSLIGCWSFTYCIEDNLFEIFECLIVRSLVGTTSSSALPWILTFATP
jgi:hypothetical protein